LKYNNKSFNRKKKNLRVLPIDNRIHIKIITINLNTHKLNGTHTKIKKCITNLRIKEAKVKEDKK